MTGTFITISSYFSFFLPKCNKNIYFYDRHAFILKCSIVYFAPILVLLHKYHHKYTLTVSYVKGYTSLKF